MAAFGILTVLFLHSCKEAPTKPPDQPPPPAKPAITLEVQYADFTEMLLKIGITDSIPGRRKQFALMRNGEQILYDTFLGKDTTIADRGLSPNSVYLYRAYSMTGSRFVDSSTVQARTRAYGSQNWRFEIDSLGADQSGAVSIFAFSKSDVWVAGSFLTRPADLHDLYGLAHWDGVRWTPVIVKNPYGVPDEGILTFGFPPEDVWFIGIRCYRYIAKAWTTLDLSLGSLNGAGLASYGVTASDIYFVGINGKIAHWDGNRFSMIPSPTTCRLLNIWGDEGTYYAAGASLDNTRSAVVRIAEMKAVLVDTLLLPSGYSTTAVWFKQKDSVFAYGGEDDRLQYRGRMIRPSYPRASIFYTYTVKGTGIENIWWVGDNMLMLHYNGSTWYKFPITQGGTVIGSLTSLDVHEDYLVACGFATFRDGTLRAVVVRGYRE